MNPPGRWTVTTWSVAGQDRDLALDDDEERSVQVALVPQASRRQRSSVRGRTRAMRAICCGREGREDLGLIGLGAKKLSHGRMVPPPGTTLRRSMGPRSNIFPPPRWVACCPRSPRPPRVLWQGRGVGYPVLDDEGKVEPPVPGAATPTEAGMKRSGAVVTGMALLILSVAAAASAGSPQAEPQEVPQPRGRGRGRRSCPARRTWASASTARPTPRRAWPWRDPAGDAPCLLGRTWGYDDGGVWVSDGCSARVRGRRRAGKGRRDGRAGAEAPRLHPQRRVPARRQREGRDVRPALQLRPLPQPEGARSDLRGLVRQHEDRAPAPGRPAEQVLPALLGLVPEPEVPLLPLRLVVERLPGRSRPGRGGGQPHLRRQPAREHRRRHHQPARRAQHGGPVPLLAGRGRPPDLGRVLPAFVHERPVAEGRADHQAQVHGHDRQQPEHARA